MTNYLFISNSSNFNIDNNLVNQINSILHNQNIQFSNREIRKNDFHEWNLKENIINDLIKNKIKNIFKNSPIDINFLNITYPRKKKILVCDMDSTIIKEESLDEIAEDAGIGREIKKITKKAMRGELDFKEALLKRIKLLNNYPLENIFRLNHRIQLNDGAKELVKKMKAESCITILISGGFSPSVSYVAKKIGFDYYHCNNFLYKKKDGRIVLNGYVQNPIIDKNSKLNITKSYVKKLNFKLDDVISVGDGANDINLIKHSDIGVSYKGKQILNNQADVVFNHTNLKGILYLQDYKI